MIKLLVVGLAVALLVSCYAPMQPEYGDGTDLRWDIPELGFTNVYEVMEFVAQHVAYSSDREANGKDDYWQSPGETYHSQIGDCEDYTILAMYLLHVELGVESHMVRGWNTKGGHTWIEIYGTWWEPQRGAAPGRDYFYKWPLYREQIDYGEAMYRADVVKR